MTSERLVVVVTLANKHHCVHGSTVHNIHTHARTRAAPLLSLVVQQQQLLVLLQRRRVNSEVAALMGRSIEGARAPAAKAPDSHVDEERRPNNHYHRR